MRSSATIIRLVIAALVAAVLGYTAAMAQQPQQPADLIVTKAKVVTIDAQRPQATAFAVQDGTFVAVGDSADMAPHRGEKTRVIDARGAGLVLDCISVQAMVDLGAKLLGRNCVWTIVGLGGGHHDFHHGSTPHGCVMSIPYWGSRVELIEVIGMARDGRIRAEITEFAPEQAVKVYDKLKAGQIRGRAILIPDGA